MRGDRTRARSAQEANGIRESHKRGQANQRKRDKRPVPDQLITDSTCIRKPPLIEYPCGSKRRKYVERGG
jgi:hypothetical protein